MNPDMKQRNLFLFLVAGLACLATMQPLFAEEGKTTDPRLQGSITQQAVKSKVAEVEADSGLDEQAKEKLLQLYRKALVNLETVASNEKSAQAFQYSAKNAPATIEKLRKQTDELNADIEKDTLTESMPGTLQEIEQFLQQEKADLAVQDAKLLDVEQRLVENAGRPAIIRQRIPEAKQQQDDVYSELKLPKASDEDAALSQARRWVLESRLQLLSAEINMLNQELLSQPLRVDLLEAERDRAEAGIQ